MNSDKAIQPAKTYSWKWLKNRILSLKAYNLFANCKHRCKEIRYGSLNAMTGTIVSFHVSFTFLVLLFWTFLVRFSGPPTPSCQKE